MVSLFNQMYAYAEMYELCDKDYSAHVKVHIRNDAEHGEAFTEQELQQLWAHKNNDIVEMILIMCYSGFRITAYKTLEINLRDRYFKGGVKTAAGKDRIVPIHSGIYDLVKHRSRQKRPLLDIPVFQFRTSMYETLESLGIARHTPHDCRAYPSRPCASDTAFQRMTGNVCSAIPSATISQIRYMDTGKLRTSDMRLKRLKFVTNLLLTETTYHLFSGFKNSKAKPLFPQYL